ncbi:DUF502 domain-containing protein [Runella slithyformis]|uniref:DUF502 domain-containing protein n=1 Tax=Runella slithyformis (strain ATCC 29530 / DSM 19594 / LMG 11500 / NCIMB 11436 / LSU 4) TaxID=761193 RepID=A0A7U4E613_RUNSL|nr:DUF502 domain-containing protein [Runella slithyformis]AEI49053.1 protein of unknown function DUF502 [Runella slithyformis DSM 19594]
MLKKRIVKRIAAYFVRGLVLVAPTYFTFVIIKEGIGYLDSILPIYIDTSDKQTLYLPGLGLLIILSGIVFLGFIFSRFVPQSFFSFGESILKRLPLVSLIYYSFKDLITAFVGDKRKFNQPVLITVNAQYNVKKLGFITQTDLTNPALEGFVAVYCPHSYAFSGELFIVSAEHIQPVDISSADVMKMIISGGVSIK